MKSLTHTRSVGKIIAFFAAVQLVGCPSNPNPGNDASDIATDNVTVDRSDIITPPDQTDTNITDIPITPDIIDIIDVPVDIPPLPVNLTVETYNVALAGSFIPFESQRRQAVIDAIANSPAEVLCVQEAWQQSDKDAIIAGATNFPHHYTVQNDLNTAIDTFAPLPGCDPLPAPTDPPCADPGDAGIGTAFNSALTCLATNCSTMCGSEQGQTTSSACARVSCGVRALLLQSRSIQCAGCLIPNLPSETFASMRDQCTTQLNGGLAFSGQNGVMLLSRHPLSNQQIRVIPGTWNRRVILSATVTLPNQQTVDVYCNHLSPRFADPILVYSGRYGCNPAGSGVSSADAWENEMRLQATILGQHVMQNTGSGRAIILGDFNSGPAPTGSATGFVTEAPTVWTQLSSEFTSGEAASFVPSCTYCADNPLINDSEPSVWIDHVFLYGINNSNVENTQIVYNESSVTVAPSADAGVPEFCTGDAATAPDAGGPTMIPRSDHYGLRSVIRIDPR